MTAAALCRVVAAARIVFHVVLDSTLYCHEPALHPHCTAEEYRDLCARLAALEALSVGAPLVCVAAAGAPEAAAGAASRYDAAAGVF